MKIERRFNTELRVTGDEFCIAGYATLYNNLSSNLGGFREIIRPGTFDRSLKDPKLDCKCLFNHAADNILGRTKSGTLTLSQDDRGLKFRCQLDRGNTAHQNLYAAISRGDISENSFAFTCAPGGQQWDEGKDPESGEDCLMRTLTNVDLLDVSPCTYPSYPNTHVGARARLYPDGEPDEVRSAVAAYVLDPKPFRKAARSAVEASRSANKATIIQLILDHPVHGRMGKRTVLPFYEAQILISSGYAKLDRP